MSHKRMTRESSTTDREESSNRSGDFISPSRESWLALFEGRLILLGNNGVLAWFLYTFGYSSFISGNKESSLLALKILKNLDGTLANLLEYRISQPIP
jgi:hypothetical protein